MECPTARAAFFLPMRRASRQNWAASSYPVWLLAPRQPELAAKLDQHDEAVTAALADILGQQPWARRFPTSELAKFLLAAREGVLARTVRDDGSAADMVQAVTAVVSAAFDALKADRQPPA